MKKNHLKNFKLLPLFISKFLYQSKNFILNKNKYHPVMSEDFECFLDDLCNNEVLEEAGDWPVDDYTVADRARDRENRVESISVANNQLAVTGFWKMNLFD